MPNHMEGEVVPSVAWRTKVSQRKAPGAMSAIALLVSPVRPRVDFIWGAFCSAMSILLCGAAIVTVGE